MPWQSHRVSELTQIWPSAQPLALASDLTPMSQFIMTAPSQCDHLIEVQYVHSLAEFNDPLNFGLSRSVMMIVMILWFHDSRKNE